MKKYLLLLTLGTLASCSQGIKQADSKPGYAIINTNEIHADASLASPEKAEKLALAAEQLMTPTSFMYADLVLDQALALDASNLRAKFYKAVVATPMSLKGIAARIKPLAARDLESLRRYNEAIANLPESGLKKFLFDGQGDIQNEKDVQAFVDSIYNAQDKLRLFLKANKNSSLTLNMSDWGIPGVFGQVIKDCAVEQTSSGTFSMKLCDIRKSVQVELNRADFEAAQYMSAGIQMYTSAITAYDFSGSIDVALKNKNIPLTSAQIWKKLIRTSDFGTLRNTKVLQNIPGMGLDAVMGIRWAISMQDELCPAGHEEPSARRGFLFSKGICLNDGSREQNDAMENVLKVIDLALAGHAVEIKKNGEEKSEMKPVVLLESPIQDLKTLDPKFNDCGQISQISDESLGGSLPNNDANDILKGSSAGCNPSSSNDV